MNKTQVREHFERLAPQFQSWRRKATFYHRQVERLCQEIIPPGAKVLELGCAQGDLLAAVRPGDGLGIDLCPSMVDAARKRYPRLRFQVGYD